MAATGSFEPVSLVQDGPLTVLEIDGDDLNLFDTAMFRGLQEATSALAADPPRGLLVRAVGRTTPAATTPPPRCSSGTW